MIVAQKLKPPHYWERQIAKYDRKVVAAKTPTQRTYAYQRKRAAENSLLASRNGTETIVADDVLDLDASEYTEG